MENQEILGYIKPIILKNVSIIQWDGYASNLVQAGVPHYEVSQLLGHKTLMTAKEYSNLAPSNSEHSVRIILFILIPPSSLCNSNTGGSFS